MQYIRKHLADICIIQNTSLFGLTAQRNFFSIFHAFCCSVKHILSNPMNLLSSLFVFLKDNVMACSSIILFYAVFNKTFKHVEVMQVFLCS